MSDPQDRLTIGEFARVTGVSSSALRFYHDCGLVVPGEVDPVTGYRYYHREQIPQVLLVRHLRGAGLPLAEVRRMLTAPPSLVRRTVRERLGAMERALQEARVSAAAALSLLTAGSCGVAVVTGGELAEAFRRVCRSADRSPGLAGDLAVLAGVLLEAHRGELTLVATDRYRLVAESLPLSPGDGADDLSRVVVAATALERLCPWLRRQDRVRLEFPETTRAASARRGDGGARLRLVSGHEHREVDVVPAEFPDYRLLLDGLPAPTTRVLAARRALLAVAEGVGPGPLCWDAAPGRGLRVTRSGDDRGVVVDAEVRGTGVRLGFDPARLHAVLAEGVGPDLGFEIARPDQPVVVRCADRSGVTTVLMPTVPGPPAPGHDHRGAA